MRTRTIYQALDCVRESSAFFATEKRVRQAGTFERELLRRMDHYDWYEARQRFFDAPHNLNGKEQNDMNDAYSRFMRHPKEQARVAAWRKERGI